MSPPIAVGFFSASVETEHGSLPRCLVWFCDSLGPTEYEQGQHASSEQEI